MRTFTLILLFLVGFVRLQAQPIINFRNDQPLINPITDARVMLSDGLVAALFTSSIDDSLNFVRFTTYTVGVGQTTPGLFLGTVEGFPETGFNRVNFTARVWETAYGATFEAAAGAAPMNGRSAIIFTCDTLQIPVSSPSPINLEFQCAAVPEPTTVAFLLGGATVLWLARRRQFVNR